MTNNEENLNNKTMALVSLAREGDDSAISALFKLYEQRLSGAVRKKLGARLHAKMETTDIIQTVWKDCLIDIDKFVHYGHDAFFHWLLARITHKIHDKGRFFAAAKRNPDRERHLPHEQTRSEASPPPVSPEPSPSQAAVASENRSRLLHLVGDLPENQRKVLVYRLKGNLEYREIAKKMGNTPGAARNLYNRAIKKIQEVIDRDPADKKE